jgi:hypothetical protein
MSAFIYYQGLLSAMPLVDEAFNYEIVNLVSPFLNAKI